MRRTATVLLGTLALAGVMTPAATAAVPDPTAAVTCLAETPAAATELAADPAALVDPAALLDPAAAPGASCLAAP
ncbi:hypothetical protein [Streptomyces tailanensis]|uniref:hypothetical protein n=1 Tax=Streptomyces tailanensis TaxID=2569858 RepID=UPI00122E9B95|nr:hypothetical protein [Streptomyces tailanensis]